MKIVFIVLFNFITLLGFSQANQFIVNPDPFHIRDGMTKVDTVAVNCICRVYLPAVRYMRHDETQWITGLNSFEYRSRMQERILEWKTVDVSPISANGIISGLYQTKTDSFPISYRWLDDVGACFHLLPLTNH